MLEKYKMTDKTKKPIEKQYFDVRVECLVPTTYHYRIYSDSAETALAEIKGKSPNGIKQNHNAKRQLKASVFTSGSSIVRFVKRFL